MRPFGTPTWRPPVKPPPHRWAPRTTQPTSGASRRASERRIAGTPTPRQPRGDGGDHPPLTPTRPRRQRQVRGPASPPAKTARHPGRDPCRATAHYPSPRPHAHTNSTTLTSANHHLPPPLHRATHVHQQQQDLQGAPHHHQQPPHPHLMPASTIHQQPPTAYGRQPHPDAQTATSHPYLETTASQGPQEPHATHTQIPTPLGRTPRLSSSTAPPPAPPATSSAAPKSSPAPPPPGTRPQTHHAETYTSPCYPQPPPTHSTASTPSRGPPETPCHQSPHATTTIPSPNPHHPCHHTPHQQPQHRQSPTPYTTPQRYDSTSGASETRRCYASTPLARPNTSGRPPWSRRPPWGRACETSSSTHSYKSPNTTAHARQPSRREPALHGKPNLGSRDRLGATRCRTPHEGASGHQGPHPLP